MSNALVDGFDEEVFRGELNAKFGGSFSASRASIPLKKDDGWERAERLGIVKTLAGSGGANMPLLVVAAKLHDGDTLKERSSRIRQFKFAKQTLDQAMAAPPSGVEGVLTQGLFVFYDDHGNFRLSLVYGRAEGAKLVWSTAKRLSFYVEAGHPNKTFRDRMALDWSTFDKLKDAFSVEKLTKEFYNRLFAWYQWALSDEMNVTYPNQTDTDDDDREINEHIIRLITRLMFVWFLKQKHLVPDNLFDPAKLKGILKNFDPLKGDNYYRAILQNLFFATLNSEIPERAFAVDAGNIKANKEHFDIKTLYRYPKEFSFSENEALKLFEKIPFLNGGLFECLDRGTDYSDGFSRNPKQTAKVPNRLFFDEAQGLIPLLSQYNFTVEENSPGDEEVALDPELLGKVFENLLGAYNPETKVAARNATGSFYTPREIVNYMVDESLIAHLKNVLTTKYAKDTKKEVEQKETKEDEIENKLRKLFAGNEGNPFGKEETAALDRALVTAKILDPACGSGAFPMGILLRMVELLRILRGIPEDQSVYDLKLELIENCIYGGDIQCIAVQISKLRFFISLVCEQKPTNEARKNYGINPLPNLETKFVAADSLIGLPRSGDALPMQNVEKLKKELWSVRHRHFLARSYQEKKELRKEDKKLRTELAKALEEGGGFDTDSARLMAEWDPYDQNTSAPFSDPEWMFNVSSGFDIVICNPPWGAKLEKEKKDLFKDVYPEIDSSTPNSFAYFVGLAQRLSNGANVFILPDSILIKDYAKTRALIKPFLRSVDWYQNMGVPDERKLFSSVDHDVCILRWGKGCPPLMECSTTTYNPSTSSLETVSWTGDKRTVMSDDFECVVNLMARDSDFKILNKILPHKRLDEFVQCHEGIHTGNCRDILFRSKKDNAFCKPLFYGGGAGDVVSNYYSRRAGWFVDYRQEVVDKKAGMYASLRDERIFSEPKLYVTRTGKPFKVFYDHDTYASNNFFSLQLKNYRENTSNSLKLLLPFLISDIAQYFVRTFAAPRLGNAFIETKIIHLLKFRVPITTPAQNQEILGLVENIIALIRDNFAADTSALESRLGKMIYDLYGLTPEEIAIVEGSGQKSSASAKATADKEDGEMDEAEKPKKKRGRKAQAALPASLPGWD